MPAERKVCPICRKSELRKGRREVALVSFREQALRIPRYQMTGVHAPVRPYVCPRCGFVALFAIAGKS